MKNAPKLIDILLKGMHSISKIEDHNEINRIIEKFLSEMLESEFISFFLFDERENRLYTITEQDKSSLIMNRADGLLGYSFISKTAAIYNHVKSEKLFCAAIDNPNNLKIKSQILYPILEDENLVGMLRISKSIKQYQNFSNFDLELLKSIEPYLLKLINILLNGNKKEVLIDQSSIDSHVQDIIKNIDNCNKEIDDSTMLLANTVHDIRTPVNSLYGFLELMEEQIDNPKLIDLISGAKESAEFISALTDSILNGAKHENEARHSELVTVNTLKFFSSIANIFTANMTDKKIHYLVSIDAEAPQEITIDTVKLKRVLINLIGNAFKFTPTDKVIRFQISYNKTTNRMKFLVQDEGLGIPQERQQEIFKAFEQAQDDTSTNFGGTGLGLSISSKYVQDMGGTLELESQVDVGSMFYFDIPVDIVGTAPIYMPFRNLEKKIVIYTNDEHCIDANNIKRFLKELGMPEEKILIGSKIPRDTTHLFCFEHKFNENVVRVCKEHNIKLVAFEERMFSISKQEKYKDITTISKNTCYGSVVYSTVSSSKKPKVLIVDDNKMNLKLFEKVLENVYCEASYKLNGEDALEVLSETLNKKTPFDMIILDKHMEGMNGTELLKRYREMESNNPMSKSTYAVSITGDIDTSEEEKALFDKIMKKPFKNTQIRDLCKIFK